MAFANLMTRTRFILTKKRVQSGLIKHGHYSAGPSRLFVSLGQVR
jgi:hypothetical protein